IVDIAYTFNQPTDYAYEDLEEVIVYLRELEDEEGRIDAVDDVVINTDEPIDVDHDEKTEAIIELLQEEWELEDKEITIEIGRASCRERVYMSKDQGGVRKKRRRCNQ